MGICNHLQHAFILKLLHFSYCSIAFISPVGQLTKWGTKAILRDLQNGYKWAITTSIHFSGTYSILFTYLFIFFLLLPSLHFLCGQAYKTRHKSVPSDLQRGYLWPSAFILKLPFFFFSFIAFISTVGRLIKRGTKAVNSQWPPGWVLATIYNLHSL